MRTSIAIVTKEKKPDATPVVRLFRMNKRQAELFESAVIGLARVSRVSIKTASQEVEKSIVKMFGGQMPSENSSRLFCDLRLAFPILKPRDIRQLPRAGCPRGRITTIILQIAFDNNKRSVLVAFDKDQADWYADAIEEIMARDGCTKDDAWLWANKVIGRLLAGAEVEDVTEEVLLMRAVNLFGGLSKEEAMELPLATEDDVERWSFTRDRIHGKQEKA